MIKDCSFITESGSRYVIKDGSLSRLSEHPVIYHSDGSAILDPSVHFARKLSCDPYLVIGEPAILHFAEPGGPRQTKATFTTPIVAIFED